MVLVAGFDADGFSPVVVDVTASSFVEFSDVVDVQGPDVVDVAVGVVFRFTKLANADFWPGPFRLTCGFLNVPIDSWLTFLFALWSSFCFFAAKSSTSIISSSATRFGPILELRNFTCLKINENWYQLIHNNRHPN